MDGIGPPLATPFDADGTLDEDRLRRLVQWVETRGVDFIVPCGSNSEAELMTAEERARTVDIVVGEASVPVLAGTGHPGLYETLEAIDRADEGGADSALVVTPFYYNHDQTTLERYYQTVADESPLPVYLYSVPAYTGVRLRPETIGRLADHPNIVGLKDSHGDIGEFIRTRARVDDADFSLLIGSANVLAQALDLGANGGILALANVAPEACARVVRTHREDPARARSMNAEYVELNTAITGGYGVPGLKWAMRERGAPAGHVRSPHRPADEEAQIAIGRMLDDLDLR